MRKRTRYKAIASLLLVWSLMPQGNNLLEASPTPAAVTLKDAKADLKKLFDQYGQVDDGSTWSYVTPEKISQLKDIIEDSNDLKDAEDWSFLNNDDECALWVSNDRFPTLYKIPLGKLRTNVDIGAACQDNCSAEMILHTKNNERAIKQLMGVRNAEGVVWTYNLTNENEVAPGLSGEKPLGKAISDVRAGIQACQENNNK